MKRLLITGLCVAAVFPINLLADTTYSTQPTSVSSEQGTAQVSVIDSGPIGLIANSHWTNYLTPNDGFGFELDFGGNEFRLGGTWAHAFTDVQRIKLTAEHLAQNLQMNFVTGTKNQWAGQNDVALDYQYLWPCSMMRALTVGGYFFNAESDNVDGPQSFTTPLGSFIDNRDFVGANAHGVDTTLTIIPWQNGRVNGSLYYDYLNYSPSYHAGLTDSGVGASLGVDQIITEHFKVGVAGSDRQLYRAASATADYLVHTRPGTRLELGLTLARVSGDFFVGQDNRAILGMSYSWGGNLDSKPATYADDNPDSLLAWTAQPAIAIPDVYVMTDEQIVHQ